MAIIRAMRKRAQLPAFAVTALSYRRCLCYVLTMTHNTRTALATAASLPIYSAEKMRIAFQLPEFSGGFLKGLKATKDTISR